MNMKGMWRNVACMVLALMALVGCMPEMGTPEFSIDDIYGKWQSGTLFYRYDYGNEGATWDTADDVTEEEAQRFTWEIVGIDMTHIYIMEMGASIPKTYVIDELTPDVLKYHDDYGKYYQFAKVDE